MKCDKSYMLLYGVTDRSWTGTQSLYQQVESALKGGVTCIQLREKDLDQETFLKEAVELCQLCHQYHVPFIINDNVEIALACKADGIHVGQDDIIGVSAHSVSEAQKAVRDGADYLGVGAMFSTSTKTDARPLSLETLRDICQAVPVPVVAIGGISKDNILSLSGSKADGVALVSAIFGAKDIEQTCQDFYQLSRQMVETEQEEI